MSDRRPAAELEYCAIELRRTTSLETLHDRRSHDGDSLRGPPSRRRPPLTSPLLVPPSAAGAAATRNNDRAKWDLRRHMAVCITALVQCKDGLSARYGDFWQVVWEITIQSSPSLVFALCGSIMTGAVLNRVTQWHAFQTIKQLFILVPILSNLKGCLEMNLASRLSTSANIGELDVRRTRRRIIVGNMALLQVQTLAIGLLAGLIAFFLGYISIPHQESWFESALMMVIAMLAASFSSIVLSSFISALCVLTRRLGGNPDNLTAPIASSVGDLITLLMLSGVSSVLILVMKSYLATLLLVLCIVALPWFILFVWRNRYVRNFLSESWTSTIISMLISSMSGVIVERYVHRYRGLAMILAATAGYPGNVGCILASRLSTQYHLDKSTFQRQSLLVWPRSLLVPCVLLLISLPMQMLYLIVLYRNNSFDVGPVFLLAYVMVNIISALVAFALAYALVVLCAFMTWNPDNIVLGLISAVADVAATSLLVLSFYVCDTARSLG